MRVAAHEGAGGAGLDGIAPRPGNPPASSAGASFFALLAFAQGGASTGDIDGSAAATQDVDDAAATGDGEAADAGEASDAALQAQAGVVVSLSAAVAANAAGAPTVATAAGGADGTSEAPAHGSAPILADGASAGAPAGAAGVGWSTDDLAAALADGTGDTSRATAGGDGEGERTGAGAGGSQAQTLPQPPAAGRAPHAGAAADGSTLAGSGAPATGSAAGARRHGVALVRGDRASASPDAASVTHAARVASSPRAAGAAEPGAAIHADDATAVARVATAGSPRVTRDQAGDGGDDTTADGDTPSATGASTSSRDLPPSVRPSSEALQPLAVRAHDASPADASTRPEALGIVRSDATAAAGHAEGTTRLRAAGFGDGTAGLPSWVERLASPDGLAATRRGNALHLDLEPNGLGRIEVRLSFGRDGVRASLLTEHEHTRTLLASQQPQLAAALERNDLRLESLLVDVGAQSGGDGRQAARDASDPTAFDQIGLVHVAEQDSATPEASLVPGVATRGLVNVRA